VYEQDDVDTEAGIVADTEGFEEFYVATAGRLLGQLLPVTGDLHEAEEVVQEAFARASTRWARLRDYELPEAWVRRVAMNLAADRHRRRHRHLAALRRVGPPAPAPPVSVEALALLHVLGTLPIRQRQAIVLHYLADLPVEEVAATLGARAGTVKSWLARGRRALAASLGEPEEVGHQP
jgi:RNA polymerase sigma-70 factor (ECF subfamily)